MRCHVAILMLACHSLLLAQRPFIEGAVRNGASYATAIAPGSIFILTGLNLGPSELVQASAHPLPRTLAGTSVEATVNGTALSAYIIYTSARQVAAVLPSRTPVGQGTITVAWNNMTSGPRTFTVAPRQFGTFTSNAAGRGAAAVHNVIASGGIEQNSLATHARPLQTVVLYGTGLGAVEGDEGSVPFPQPIADTPVDLYVGGQRAQVRYAGRSGCCAGLDQINFVVPQDVEGCHVPVLASVGGVLSNTTTIAVAREGAVSCSDAHGRSADQLVSAKESGTLSEANIVLSQVRVTQQAGLLTFPVQADVVFASFSRYPFDRLLLSTGFSVLGPPPTPGACYTWPWGSYAADERVAADPLDFVSPQPLDPGPALTVAGPRGALRVERSNTGKFDPLRGLFLEPGTWSVTNGSGGTDIGPFQAQLTIPSGLRWTNESSTTVIQRSQGYTAEWTGAGAGDLVAVSGSSPGAAGVAFTCFARGDAGRLTVPPYILEGLPDLSSVGIALSTSTPISAPGLGAGRFTYVSVREKPVAYR